jgi:hypothetical protein
MRLNAPIPAILALAALFFLPATLLAKTTHRYAHRLVSVRSAQPAHKKPTPRSHTSKKQHKIASPTIARVRAQGSVHHTRHRTTRAEISRRSSPAEPLTASDTAPQKATSDDFLKAATPQAEVPKSAAPSEKSSLAETRIPARRTRSRGRRSASVAKPVSVVSVIRPTTEKPQLESPATEAATPVILPALYNKRGRLIVPPPLRGSREILLHQNQVADRDGLDRIQNDADLIDMRGKRMLVSIPASNALQVDERLPIDRRYCRPWTAEFLANLSRAHYARFHTPLQVNSAVRTVEFQQHLMRINGNAAPAGGDTASPHLTGQAVDLAKHGLSLTEIAWMRGYLLPLVQEGKVDVEEEFQQACFHISVYKKYLPPASTPRRSIATMSRETSTLATAIR